MTKETVNTNLKSKNKKNRDNQKRRMFREKIVEKIVQIKRVSKVVKGGKKISFRVVAIVGFNRNVGIGVGKANDVTNAVKKAVARGKKKLTKIPITKTSTIPHKVEGIYGACNVIIRPSPVGSGVIAGSSTRTLLEVVGIRNVVAKQIGSKNSLNNARATLVALQGLKNISETAEDRDVTVESLY